MSWRARRVSRSRAQASFTSRGRAIRTTSGEYDFDNPVLDRRATATFALTALAGPGAAGGRGADTRLHSRRAHRARQRASSSIARPHAFAWIDLPAEKDKEIAEARLTLRKGVKLEARLVGPDGKPVDMVDGLVPGIDGQPARELGVTQRDSRRSVPARRS